MANKEQRKFTMHDNLLSSVIREQAGSFFKAVLEGVQNSADAGATRIEVKLGANRLEIIDNGRGFQTKQEVDEYFACFGTPHPDDEEDVFGKFRMGRGQLMSLGNTCYRTGPFQFDVDIEHQGLGFVLTQDLPWKAGCHIVIDLYTSLTLEEQHRIGRDLKKAVKYFFVPVIFNGETISTPPDQVKWDKEDDDAYYLFKDQGSIAIYHRGCFITDYPSHTLGSGGVVVAKSNLWVNFARNDIKDACPVWRRIRKHFQSTANQKNKKRSRLDDAAKQNLIEQIVDGSMDISEVMKVRLLTDTGGSSLSFKQMLNYHTFNALAFAPHGDRVADRAMASKTALVLDEIMLERFGVSTPEAWLELVSNRIPYAQRVNLPTLVSMDVLKERFHDGYEILDEKQWTPLEHVWVQVLSTAAYWRLPQYFGQSTKRTIRIGLSGVADAWTDGISYIAINRDYLKAMNDRGMEECYQLAQLIVHEYCHNDTSMGSHLHDKQFYQAYHDAADITAAVARDIFSALTNATMGKKKMTTTKIRKTQDRIEAIRREITDLIELTEKLDRENETLEVLLEERKQVRKKRTATKSKNTRLKKRAA